MMPLVRPLPSSAPLPPSAANCEQRPFNFGEQRPTHHDKQRQQVHEQRPSLLYQMKRQLVESVIDQQFAKYEQNLVQNTTQNATSSLENQNNQNFAVAHEAPELTQSMDKSTIEQIPSSGTLKLDETCSVKDQTENIAVYVDETTNEEDMETIIDIEGEKECSYIRRVVDDPAPAKKRPSWSVADMLRQEPPKRPKARRKPQTPLCYREPRDELVKSYEDFHRVPYLPYMSYMRDREAFEHNVQAHIQRQHQMLQHQAQQNSCVAFQKQHNSVPNIGSHQFSILGHRKYKTKNRAVVPTVRESPLDVTNLVGEGKKDQTENTTDNSNVERDDSESSNPVPQSPKPKYVPRFFQNLAKEDVSKFVDKKALNVFASIMNKNDTQTPENKDNVDLQSDPEKSPSVIDTDLENKAHTDGVGSEQLNTIQKDKTESKADDTPADKPNDFAGMLQAYIACVLDRGALDLSQATTSSSKLINDKLNNVSYPCSCQPRRKANPSRSSAKAGVLEPLPVSCTPSPPPDEEEHEGVTEPCTSSWTLGGTSSDNKVKIPMPVQPQTHNHNQFFLERTRQLNNFNMQAQLPGPYLQHQQFMRGYEHLFKMAALSPAAFPMMHQPFQMNGPFLVPSMPPPKRQRLIPGIF